ISRALEIFEQTGEPISVLRRRATPATGLTAAVLVLDPPLERLRVDIARRFDAMMEAGLLEETRALRAAFGTDARALQSLGYSQMGDFLDGRATLPDAVAAAKTATATYARRQRTFFRKQVGARRAVELPPPEDVLGWWKSTS
ncbi:MAG TPA: tRNA dimethylallyltransferase, partial [Polyangia bacterium]|nr:tRNA dimethylallyltransferase [Polyangia bacterium]